MPSINFIEWVGYAASILVAVSLLMSSILRLRWYNLIGSILFSIYGFIIGAFPVGIINSFIIIINLYYLYKLYSRKEYFKILEFSKGDSYIKDFFTYYAEDIKSFFPDFIPEFGETSLAFIVLRNMVPAGVFIGKRLDDDTLFIDLDFVTPEYRDFKIGLFIYTESREFFLSRGYKSFSTYASNEVHNKYLKRMGFAQICKNGNKTLVKAI